MFRRQILKKSSLTAALVALGLFFLLFPIEGKNNIVKASQPDLLITGIGSIDSTVVRCHKVISDCVDMDPNTPDADPSTDVQLIFRETDVSHCDDPEFTKDSNPPAGDRGVAFSGLIQNAKSDGHQLSRALRDNCSLGFPPQGTAKLTYTLDNATITDPVTGESRTGGLKMETNYIFEGDATSPSGARARIENLTITGGSGQLAGARGQIEYVSPKSTAGKATSYYYAEIRVPGL